MKEHIFLSSPHMSEEGFEQEYVKEAFETNWIAPLGKNVTGFETEIEQFLQTKKSVALSSGTAAIHMALKSVGVEQGDIIFCQSLTFSATANPILYEKAIPVFIDSNYETWNMCPIALEKAFERYNRQNRLPKAVIVVHLYGICADIERIVTICQKYKVPLIEDAAESLGSTFGGRYTGTFGDYGVISFNGNKIITTSGGGMLLFNSEDAEEKAKEVLFWATQARDSALWYQHSQIGYNYRMSNVVAGIGRGQLKVLQQRIEQKRAIYSFYEEKLSKYGGLQMMPLQEGSNCWLTAIMLVENCKVKPLDIIRALEEDDIESRPVWKPLHLQPIFEEYDFISIVDEIHNISKETNADSSIAGTIFQQGVCLPSDSKMLNMDLERIYNVIKKLWG